MRYLISIYIIVFLTSCKKVKFEIDNLNENRIEAFEYKKASLLLVEEHFIGQIQSKKIKI